MDEPLQSCDLLGFSKGPSGNCTADIDIHELEKLASISQKCKINPGQEKLLSMDTECMGCWHSINPNSLEVLPIVRYTIQQFNNHSKHLALFHLERVIKIDRQVVAGWNYHFEYLIKETNCSKNDFPDLSPACRPLLGGQQGSCTVYANVNSADSLVYAEQTCRLPAKKKERSPDMCAGCPIPLPLDSPELKKLLGAALESYNAKSDRDFYFKVVAVLKATSQVVNGVIYKFDFKIQQTTCSKAVVEKPNEDCTAVEDGELLYCSGSEFQQPSSKLQSIINPEVNCGEQQPLQHSGSYSQVLGELLSISQEGRINAGQEKLLSMDTECMGCWHPIHSKSLEVLPIVRYTIRQFNNHSKHPALFEVGQITEAYVQVVAGLNYHFEYLIKETNCSKNEFPDLSPACRPLLGGQQGSCIVYAYVDLTNSLEYAEQACRLPAEKKERSPDMCAGCPIPLPLDSPELKKLLGAALESYNAKSDRDFYFKVVAVLKATSQVVNGVIYKFDFKIQQTTCSKAVVEKPNEDCTAVEDGELLYCSGSEFQQPSSKLLSIINPEVNCREQQPLQQQGSCIADIYIISGNSLVTIQKECKVQVEEKAKPPAYKCTACLMPIPPDSPELKEPLEAIMKYLNCSKGVEVTKATKQVVSGITYRIDFIMQKIYCSKPEFQHPNEDSTAVEDDVRH
ncbi:uncharacterized protein PHA67_022033 isoform 2-T3 [Liasis olivaceus]